MVLAGGMKVMPERISRVGALLKPWDPVLGREPEHPPMDDEALYIVQCQPDISVTNVRNTVCLLISFLS
jgi:hypothetical protein